MTIEAPRIQTEPTGIEQQRRLAIHHQLGELFRKTQATLGIPAPKEEDRNRIITHIDDNDAICRQLRSSEYMEVLGREWDLIGSCKTGVVMCIDGRLSIPHLWGRIINVWEVAGSLVSAERRGGKAYLKSSRLIDILRKTATETNGRDLLEIVTAHTSSTSDHKCGKMTAVAREHGLGLDSVDETAMSAAQIRAEAIENTYNGILELHGKKPQAQVAVVAMVDTDTMGLTLNYGKDNALSTTQLFQDGTLAAEIGAQLGYEVGSYGSMQRQFASKNSLLTYARRVEGITRHLMHTDIMEENSVSHRIIRYLNVNYPKLTKSQRQALFFTVCRTIANQYLTGLATGEAFAHPFNEHDEEYIVVAPFGKPFGRFDHTRQSFGSTPSDRHDALSHVKTKLSIMDSHEAHGHASGPRIIYLSNPVKGELFRDGTFMDSVTLSEILDSNRKYYQRFMGDLELRARIDAGSVILVPILVDEITGETLHILEDSPLIVERGEAIPDMP